MSDKKKFKKHTTFDKEMLANALLACMSFYSTIIFLMSIAVLSNPTIATETDIAQTIFVISVMMVTIFLFVFVPISAQSHWIEIKEEEGNNV